MPNAYPVAVLDACVLYPAPIRDLLLQLASTSLYAPKWTALLQAEWMRKLLQNRPDLSFDQLRRTQTAMNGAFPTAEVTQFESLVAGLALPNPDDRHVLAAASQAQAEVIVTSNLKDFSASVLTPYAIVAQHPDAFIASLLDEYPRQGLPPSSIPPARPACKGPLRGRRPAYGHHLQAD